MRYLIITELASSNEFWENADYLVMIIDPEKIKTIQQLHKTCLGFLSVINDAYGHVATVQDLTATVCGYTDLINDMYYANEIPDIGFACLPIARDDYTLNTFFESIYNNEDAEEVTQPKTGFHYLLMHKASIRFKTSSNYSADFVISKNLQDVFNHILKFEENLKNG